MVAPCSPKCSLCASVSTSVNKNNSDPHLIELCRVLDELIYTKYLKQFLAYRTYYIKWSAFVTTLIIYFKIEHMLYIWYNKKSRNIQWLLGSILETSSKIFMALASKISVIFSTAFQNIFSLQNQIGHFTRIAFLIIIQGFRFHSSWSLKYCQMQKFKMMWSNMI